MAEPGAVRLPQPLQEGLLGRSRYGWVFAAVWLVYLVDVLADALRNPNRIAAAVGTFCVVAFAALYVAVFPRVRTLRRAARTVSPRGAVATLALGVTLTLGAALSVGQSALAMAVFLAVIVMFVLPLRAALVGVAVLVVGVEVSSRTVPGWAPQDQLGFQVVVTAFAIWGVLQMVARNAELAIAQRQLADLAVAAERNRFARDLHDLLGHSLTVITLKTELAGRLVRLDPDRAEQEIAEVERLAREALVDVRSAVSGYREANLAQELVAARAALDAAGIEAELPTAVDGVQGERRELYGWVVREGVTNVIRHSGARTCRIVLHDDEVRIEDDGAGALDRANGVRPAGHGLEGLRERAEAVGARLVVGRSELGGFLLRTGWDASP